MSFFIPVSTDFKNAVLDRLSARYWKLLIDIDGDENLEDVTHLILNNSLTGRGQRAGNNFEAVSNKWSVVLKNSIADYKNNTCKHTNKKKFFRHPVPIVNSFFIIHKTPLFQVFIVLD